MSVAKQMYGALTSGGSGGPAAKLSSFLSGGGDPVASLTSGVTSRFGSKINFTASRDTFELTLELKPDVSKILDRRVLQRLVSKARQRALMKAGAFVRRRALSLLRRRKSSSAVGSPPSIHTERGAKGPGAGLKWITFQYDRGSDSVVVGPVRLNKVVHGEMANMRLPQLMEFGGQVAIHEEARKDGKPWSEKIGQWRRRDLRAGRKTWKVYRTRRAQYGPRPFMAPAIAQALPDLPKSCKDLLLPGAVTVQS